jgi:hypothetical protein
VSARIISAASLKHWDARLMPAKYVRPYSKGQKNDFCDAEAMAEAVQRPTMKFVATKTADQLDRQGLSANEIARADTHDGLKRNTLQSEAGYIDARLLTISSTKTSCDAQPDHTLHWVSLRSV